MWSGTANKIILTFDWFLSMVECRSGKQIENINWKLSNLEPIDYHVSSYFYQKKQNRSCFAIILWEGNYLAYEMNLP